MKKVMLEDHYWKTGDQGHQITTEEIKENAINTLVLPCISVFQIKNEIGVKKNATIPVDIRVWLDNKGEMGEKEKMLFYQGHSEHSAWWTWSGKVPEFHNGRSYFGDLLPVSLENGLQRREIVLIFVESCLEAKFSLYPVVKTIIEIMSRFDKLPKDIEMNQLDYVRACLTDRDIEMDAGGNIPASNVETIVSLIREITKILL